MILGFVSSLASLRIPRRMDKALSKMNHMETPHNPLDNTLLPFLQHRLVRDTEPP
jgi:hypothetical protein